MPTELRQCRFADFFLLPRRRLCLLLDHPGQTSPLLLPQFDSESWRSGSFAVRDVAGEPELDRIQSILAEGEAVPVRGDESPRGDRLRDGIGVDDTFRKSVERLVRESSDVESDSELGKAVDLSNLNVDWRRTSFQSLNCQISERKESRENATYLLERSRLDTVLIGSESFADSTRPFDPRRRRTTCLTNFAFRLKKTSAEFAGMRGGDVQQTHS